ncbi:MAG: hypothetical protein Q8L39_10530 [Burkholderiales bacterium]|nr:hypothetical protein [Burkholderiales bacterium]
MNEISLRNTIESIRQDALRYVDWRKQPGFWVTLSYRVRRLRKFGAGPFRLLLVPSDVCLGLVKWIVSDSTIPSSVDVDPGLYLPHPNGLVISYRARIGAQVAIFQQVTLGEWQNGVPVVEDGCALYAGAKVIGGITIGSQSKIGANVVVNANIPASSSVSVATASFRVRSSTTQTENGVR